MVFVHEGGAAFRERCIEVVASIGFALTSYPTHATVAIAPLLTRRLERSEFEAPRIGTLIFHPSALPYRRGPDALRRAVEGGERVTAATWFWCADGWDTGDICEQETVVLHPSESAGRAYWTRVVPAGLRALERALRGVASNRVRRVPQEEALATYDAAMGPKVRG